MYKCECGTNYLSEKGRMDCYINNHGKPLLPKRSSRLEAEKMRNELDQLRSIAAELARALEDAMKTARFEKHPLRAWHSLAVPALARYQELLK